MAIKIGITKRQAEIDVISKILSIIKGGTESPVPFLLIIENAIKYTKILQIMKMPIKPRILTLHNSK
jgi:hypothetical protein